MEKKHFGRTVSLTAASTTGNIPPGSTGFIQTVII